MNRGFDLYFCFTPDIFKSSELSSLLFSSPLQLGISFLAKMLGGGGIIISEVFKTDRIASRFLGIGSHFFTIKVRN